MEETIDVNRDTIAANVGSHITDTEALFEEEETFVERVDETTHMRVNQTRNHTIYG